MDVLKLIIRSLRTQLEEQRMLSDQRCQALLEDRCEPRTLWHHTHGKTRVPHPSPPLARLIREQEYEERVKTLKTGMEKTESDLQEVSELHQSTTKDYLVLRHESQAKETALQVSPSSSRHCQSIVGPSSQRSVVWGGMKTSLTTPQEQLQALEKENRMMDEQYVYTFAP